MTQSEESGERNLAFTKLNQLRNQKYATVQKEYQRLDDVAFEAYPVHLAETSERLEHQRMQELIEAQNAHTRAVRDE